MSLVEGSFESFFGSILLLLVFLSQLEVNLVPLGWLVGCVFDNLPVSVWDVALDEGVPQFSIIFSNLWAGPLNLVLA